RLVGELHQARHAVRHPRPVRLADVRGLARMGLAHPPAGAPHLAERSWRAGQRVLVNHLVANRQLCEIYPLKRNTCDEMEVIRIQAKRMRELEAYIDGLSGGPGKGWFRIVRSSAEAREVIEKGRLAVVLGVEASEP